jgi:hypothetical protein
MPGGQGVSSRSTEGVNRGESTILKMSETKRQRGRPKGSKNKAKSLIPREMALEIVDRLEPIIQDKEHFEYLKGVIVGGKAIALDRELDTIILLLNRQLVPAMMAEIDGPPLPEGVEDPNPSAIKMPEFDKSVTERLKVLKEFIALKSQRERASDEPDNSKEPILQIFAKRGIDGDRLRIAIEHRSGGLVGSTDEFESEADSAGNVSEAISVRPISLPGRGQGEADRA